MLGRWAGSAAGKFVANSTTTVAAMPTEPIQQKARFISNPNFRSGKQLIWRDLATMGILFFTGLT
jgi:hypothetical protein